MARNMLAEGREGRKGDSGYSLLECLFAMALLSITALAITHSTIHSYVFAKRAIRQSIAAQLAQSKLEEMSVIDPVTLDSGDNTIENGLSVDGIGFDRTMSITVNADDSRTVSVTVTPIETTLGSAVTFETDYALWGNT